MTLKLTAAALPAHPPEQAMALLEENGVRLPVMVSVDDASKTIAAQIGMRGSHHATMTASTAAGTHFLGGGAEGVAPGAGLVVNNSCGMGAAQDVRALAMAFRDPRIDVITTSGCAEPPGGARWSLSVDQTVGGQLLQRLETRYPKLYFNAVGNGGATERLTTAHGQALPDSIAIGGYVPAEAWKANLGVIPTRTQTLAPYSKFGPSSDGALKPELLGLTEILSAGDVGPESSENSPVFGPLPGYLISGGTSAAAPNAAGHAALLISAAKQSGIPHDSARVRMALFSTAKFLDGVEARQQGHGLIQVSKAWEALRKLSDFVPPTFKTYAPLRTKRSGERSAPNVGQGLYETEGWAPGTSGTREIVVVRTSGPRSPSKYQLRWHESANTSDEAFAPAFSSSYKEVSLALNEAVKIPVAIQVGASGSYSAILDLVDPTVGLTVHSVMCTVIVAEPLSARNRFMTTVTRRVPSPGNAFVFADVPSGTSLLRVRLEQYGGKNLHLQVNTPEGIAPREQEKAQWLPLSDGVNDYTFRKPLSGVWQFDVTQYEYAPGAVNAQPAREVPITV